MINIIIKVMSLDELCLKYHTLSKHCVKTCIYMNHKEAWKSTVLPKTPKMSK